MVMDEDISLKITHSETIDSHDGCDLMVELVKVDCHNLSFPSERDAIGRICASISFRIP